ncbi:hypothetical protein HBI23_256000 [Parastagonospora nodorum]|nr:hypothetical protein HBI23_256000 [Parastagonospora nodorum]KAH5620474.1 hypothetical protein HBI51_251160 [Parastagonospora nodorum]KAH5982907.1 hypothetical protein HBI84_250000 [Parastagonospora nodorum]KAH6132806.1 hypothetical protein HBI68_255290 [Parastagonospora nodorum]KAH6380457.1 hypothetical protein HBI08_238860 [Parastagonospora nodorum]
MLHSKGIALLLLLCSERAHSHSWLEQLSNIAPNGTFYRFGYPRGFVDKGIAGFDQSANNWLLPPSDQPSIFVQTDHLLCHPSQRAPTQRPDFPRLQAPSGGTIALRYAENGHVTLPGGGKNLIGKPKNGGTVFVFGTQEPRSEEKLVDVLRWTRDGSGGDRRGRLLTAQDFDDGRCYQLGNAPLANGRKAQTPNPVAGQPGSEHELLCETDVKLPETVQTGVPLTLYWVWQWPTAARVDPRLPFGKDEYYVSCVDVDIVSSLQPDHVDRLLAQQDPMSVAVPGFQSRGALTSDPLALSSQSGFGPKSVQQTHSAAHAQVTPHMHKRHRRHVK